MQPESRGPENADTAHHQARRDILHAERSFLLALPVRNSIFVKLLSLLFHSSSLFSIHIFLSIHLLSFPPLDFFSLSTAQVICSSSHRGLAQPSCLKDSADPTCTATPSTEKTNIDDLATHWSTHVDPWRSAPIRHTESSDLRRRVSYTVQSTPYLTPTAKSNYFSLSQLLKSSSFKVNLL